MATTVELRRPRARPGTLLWLLQVFAALSFASYFFFWLIGLGLLVALIVADVVGKSTAVLVIAAYLCSIAVYQPQFGRGWPFHWFLYSRFVDWVLCCSRSLTHASRPHPPTRHTSPTPHTPHTPPTPPTPHTPHTPHIPYTPSPVQVLGYYDATCIREGPALDPEGRYLFAMVPHGVFGVCRAFSGGSLWRGLYPGVAARWWGSFGGAFRLPGVREFSLACGCLDAGRPTLTRAVQRGESLMLLATSPSPHHSPYP